MSVSFNVKVKHYDKTITKHKFDKDKGKEISKLLGQKIEEDIVAIAGSKIVETVAQHNERVLTQAAIFFQRVVTRTPKDERYVFKSGVDGEYITHNPDKDYIWKSWKIKYWGKELSAEDIGEEYFESEQDFNNAQKINEIKEIIKNKLFRGEDNFAKRKSRIRNIRFENQHPRFAMLEYGTYEIKNSDTIKEGKKHYHGIQNGYSVQAPYGMLRITQAEIASMSMSDFDTWIKKGISKVTRIPSKAQMKELKKILGTNGITRRHLSSKDIDAVTKVYEK